MVHAILVLTLFSVLAVQDTSCRYLLVELSENDNVVEEGNEGKHVIYNSGSPSQKSKVVYNIYFYWYLCIYFLTSEPLEAGECLIEGGVPQECVEFFETGKRKRDAKICNKLIKPISSKIEKSAAQLQNCVSGL